MSCVDAVLKRLAFAERPVPVVLSGGLFRSSIVAERVTSELVARGEVRPVRPALPPIGGARVLVSVKAGVPVTCLAATPGKGFADSRAPVTSRGPSSRVLDITRAIYSSDCWRTALCWIRATAKVSRVRQEVGSGRGRSRT